MTNKSEWQEANRRLTAEERRRLGEPPTAEEMLAYSRGELSESDEERIRDLLVAYPELARMYAAEFPEAPQPGDPDAVSDDEVHNGWTALQPRLGVQKGATVPPRAEAQRGVLFRHYFPTTIAAAFALVFFGLFVQAESRARFLAKQGALPRVLAAPQELPPDGNRGPGAPTMLRKDGEAYLLKPMLINQVRYAHYHLELHDAKGAVIWRNATAQPDENDMFQIVVPHEFLRAGERYQLRISGVDGETGRVLGTYDVAAPAE